MIEAQGVRRVVAAGSGRMGRGMAVAFAYAGIAVSLLDLKVRDPDQARRHAEEVRAEIDAHLESLQRINLIGSSDADRIAASIELHTREESSIALADACIVFEGVPERLDDKRAAFELIESLAPADCVLASTTSSFLSTQLATMCSRPERFLDAHWLNPAYLIPLVEVSPHAGTDPLVLAFVEALLRRIGKVPVVCRPSPGFIVPRLQALLMNEAARLVEEGVASAEEVDRAVRVGFGLRYASMGVLEFVDAGGLDILYRAGRYMADNVDAQRYATPAIVERLMQSGDIGLRSGRGLYDWRTRDAAAWRDETLVRMVRWLKSEGLLPPLAQRSTP